VFSEWHKWFEESRENVKNYEKICQKSHRIDENVQKVRNLVHSDRRTRAMDVQLHLDKKIVKKA
jgi:hypothetical protein